MKLFEFASDIVDDIILILKNQKGSNNSVDSSGTVSYAALNNMLKNIGYGNVNYDDNTFSEIYDKSPEIQELVTDYDKDKIVLSTIKQPSEPLDKFDTSNSASVKKMASSSNPYK